MHENVSTVNVHSELHICVLYSHMTSLSMCPQASEEYCLTTIMHFISIARDIYCVPHTVVSHTNVQLHLHICTANRSQDHNNVMYRCFVTSYN